MSALTGLRRRARQAARTWQILGYKGLVGRLENRLYYRRTAVRMMVDLASWHFSPAASPGIRVTRGTLSELIELRTRYHPGRLPREFYMDRLSELRTFWLATVRDELAGIAWLVGPGAPNLIVLAADQREIRLCHVLPEYRGRGIFRLLLEAALTDLKREGVTRVYCHVRPDNVASLKSVATVGMGPTGVLRSFRFFLVKHERFHTIAARPGDAGLGAPGVRDEVGAPGQ